MIVSCVADLGISLSLSCEPKDKLIKASPKFIVERAIRAIESLSIFILAYVLWHFGGFHGGILGGRYKDPLELIQPSWIIFGLG